MLLSVLLTSTVALAGATVLLVVLGAHVRFASSPVGVAIGVAFAAATGAAAEAIWGLPERDAAVGGLCLVGVTVVVVVARRVWNPIGQLFFAATLTAAASYLALAGWVTVSGVLSPLESLASALLWIVEAAAFVITASFAFECCDVVCRVRWVRPAPTFDLSHDPMVSLHVPAYAEPPDMLIETIGSLEALDYRNFEIVVIDNNTKDEELWRPVERYCRGRPRIRFVHVDSWPGYKSGALNLALRAHTNPAAEIIGVVDADYVVSPDYLRATVGYFASANLAFVQTPQDYREWEGDTYLTACHDAYRYFFETAMPSRNDRNSIIFGGTMGLIRRSVLEEIGGWDEHCITEDAEASLRILRSGYSGFYLNRSFGRGIMPLTFGSLKRQMFRWCFGGIQILRMHARSLLPWDRRPENELSIAQRFDYLLGGFQWFGNLVGLAFTAVLGLTAATLLARGRVPFGPLLGAAVILPMSMLVSGLVRALWALRRQARIGVGRASLAFAVWLSLSWTIAVACLQGLARRAQPFIRTPKRRSEGGFRAALRAARAESVLAGGAFACAVALGATGRGGLLIVSLFAWQGLIYATSPTMAWLNEHSHLSARLERLRRAEERRERFGMVRPHIVGAGLGTVTAAVAAVVLAGTLSGQARNDRLHSIFTPPSTTPGAGSGATNDSGAGGANPPGGTGTGTGANTGNRSSVPSGGQAGVSSGQSTTTSPGTGATTTTIGPTGTTLPGATTTTRPGATTTTRPVPSTTVPATGQGTTTTNPHRP